MISHRYSVNLKNGNKNKYTVLLCDDEKFIIDMYAYRLRTEGYNVVVVESGDKVIPGILENKIDIVILDLMMPVKTGFEVLQEFQNPKYAPYRKIPIIVMSNLGQQCDIDTARALGAVEYFIKANIIPSELCEKVLKYIPHT